MEISEIVVTPRPDQGDAVEAEFRADVCFGDRGYWITVNGWGGTEAEAREQIEVAMKALGLTVEKIGEVI